MKIIYSRVSKSFLFWVILPKKYYIFLCCWFIICLNIKYYLLAFHTDVIWPYKNKNWIELWWARFGTWALSLTHSLKYWTFKFSSDGRMNIVAIKEIWLFKVFTLRHQLFPVVYQEKKKLSQMFSEQISFISLVNESCFFLSAVTWDVVEFVFWAQVLGKSN